MNERGVNVSVQKNSTIWKVCQREIMCFRCLGCVHKQGCHKCICYNKVNNTLIIDNFPLTNLSTTSSNIVKGTHDILQERLIIDSEI